MLVAYLMTQLLMSRAEEVAALVLLLDASRDFIEADLGILHISLSRFHILLSLVDAICFVLGRVRGELLLLLEQRRLCALPALKRRHPLLERSAHSANQQQIIEDALRKAVKL